MYHGLKKTEEENFDVPMGCYDGAEVCELMGTYIWNKFKNLKSKRTSVYIVMIDWEYLKIYPKQK